MSTKTGVALNDLKIRPAYCSKYSHTSVVRMSELNPAKSKPVPSFENVAITWRVDGNIVVFLVDPQII